MHLIGKNNDMYPEVAFQNLIHVLAKRTLAANGTMESVAIVHFKPSFLLRELLQVQVVSLLSR